MYNLGRAGLTFWSPVINVVRDPRWGRTQETPGEDPFVVGRYAANFVRGLQDVRGTEHIPDLNARPLKVSACCKHYAAYDVDNWKGVDRLHFDARVTEQDMVETFLKPFEMCVKEGDVSSIMCSYNRVNGIPTCADPKLLNQTVRGDWGLRGYLVSDCDSIEVMVDNHQFINDTNEDAVAQTLKAGLDLDCGNYYPKFTMSSIRQGKVSVEDVDKALRNLYMLMMRLGYFDGSPEFKNLGKKDICSSRNIDLAVEAARQGIVLLKNDNGTLPFDRNTIKNLAVVGPHASVTDIMIGNYAGTPCRYITPTDGFSTYTNVQTQQGCEDVLCNNDKLIGAAVDAAKTADATVIMVGLSLKVEAESLDRLHLFLPGFQTQLINQVADAAKGPVVLIIMSAGGIDITFAKNNPKIKAILWAGYPGQEGGRAIADVVFGTYNPGGRLPITWYEGSYVEKLPMTSMQLRPLDNLGYPGRTYKFYNGTTVYPFGYGLSYSQFTYKIQSPNPSTLDVKLTRFQHCHDIDYKPGTQKPTCPSVKIEDGLACDTHYTINTQIQITNTGTRDGDQAVIVYSKAPEGILGAPIKQVIGFRRVGIRAGQTVTVPFQFNACKALSIVDYQAHTVLPAGQHSIVVGDGVASYTYDVNFT
ncbi:probable beta-D-xylosidase 5 [Carica papaya]|uniref:probable beta-D-xylosidase 5 n=1 Tax=Carica papaya TaxID=3649 RepID=UPI000B8CEF6A|nr:probable beta-D-xylosidase 5 [Carica papaya]